MRILSLKFRSYHHEEWFRTSTLLFVAAIVAIYDGALIVPYTLLCLHALVLICALHALNFGRIVQDETFSRDCIWYNGGVCIVYGALIAFHSM